MGQAAQHSHWGAAFLRFGTWQFFARVFEESVVDGGLTVSI